MIISFCQMPAIAVPEKSGLKLSVQMEVSRRILLRITNVTQKKQCSFDITFSNLLIKASSSILILQSRVHLNKTIILKVPLKSKWNMIPELTLIPEPGVPSKFANQRKFFNEIYFLDFLVIAIIYLKVY